MVLPKTIRYGAFCLLLIANAAFGQGKSLEPSIQRHEKHTELIFHEETAVARLELPTISATLWGPGNECRAATIRFNDRRLFSSAHPDAKTLEFFLNEELVERITLIPAFVTPTDQLISPEPIITGKKGAIKKIENKLTELSQKTLAFQQQQRCFSCHQIVPLTLAIKEAARNDLTVPLNEIELLGESLSAMQNNDGSFFFAKQPEYGKIATSLCAGAFLAENAMFDRRMLVSLEKLTQRFPEWLDDESDMKSDFYFRPLFIGKITSAAFEASIAAAMYYFRPQITQTPLDETLRQRLVRLAQRFRFSSANTTWQNLIATIGLPHTGQLANSQKQALIDQTRTFLQQDALARRIDVKAIAALFLARMNDKKALQQIKPPQGSGLLSDELWLCLIQILQSQIE